MPVTPKMILGVERQLGVKLPTSYVRLLASRNGGYLRYNTFPSPTPTSWAFDHVGIRTIRGIGPGLDADIVDLSRELQEIWMVGHLIAIDTDGRRWLALDYRISGPTGDPSVVWIDTEQWQEVQLAHDFQAFVEGLVDGNPDFVYGFVEVGAWVNVLAQKVSDILGLPFIRTQPQSDPPAAAPHSMQDTYFQFAATDNSAFIYPNMRENGQLTYPEHPECDWLLSCNIDKDKGEALDALLADRLPFPVVRVHTPPWQGPVAPWQDEDQEQTE